MLMDLVDWGEASYQVFDNEASYLIIPAPAAA